MLHPFTVVPMIWACLSFATLGAILLEGSVGGPEAGRN